MVQVYLLMHFSRYHVIYRVYFRTMGLQTSMWSVLSDYVWLICCRTKTEGYYILIGYREICIHFCYGEIFRLQRNRKSRQEECVCQK